MPSRTPKPLPDCFIGKVVANRRIKRFQDEKLNLLSAPIGKGDTKSVWFRFETIEDIYKELVYLNANGLRVYFAAYEDKVDPQDPLPEKQLTVIFVATERNAQGQNEDIILEDLPNFPERQQARQGAATGADKEFNYGSPCPPDCGDGSGTKFPQ